MENKTPECEKVGEQLTQREVIFIGIFAFIVFCFGMYELISKWDTILECCDCIVAFRDNNMEDANQNEPSINNILEIPDFHSISQRLKAPDLETVDAETQTDLSYEKETMHNNPMYKI